MAVAVVVVEYSIVVTEDIGRGRADAEGEVVVLLLFFFDKTAPVAPPAAPKIITVARMTVSQKYVLCIPQMRAELPFRPENGTSGKVSCCEV